MGNPSKTFELIRLYPKLTSDPITGKIGEIYYNSVDETLRICINDSPLTWANVVVSFAGLGNGSSDFSTLRWDSVTLKWVENDQIYLENNSIHGKNNSDNDGLAAQNLTINAANKTAGTGDGGNLILNAGSSIGGAKGDLEINSSSVILSGTALVTAAEDSVLDSSPAQNLTINAANKTAGTGDGGNLILNAGSSFGGAIGKIILNGYLLDIQAQLPLDPATGSAGQLYFNTTSNAFKFHNGIEWVAIGDLLSDGSIAMNGDFNLDSHYIINVLDPVNDQDAATKIYVDTKAAETLSYANLYTNALLDVEITEREYQDSLLIAEDLTFLKLDGSRSMTGALDMGTHKIENLSDGTLASDAVNKSQLDTVEQLIVNQNEITNEPTGFEDRNHSELLFDDNSGNPIFTIQPKSPYTSFDFYVKGVKYTKSSAQTVNITSHPSFPYAGNNYFYFDQNGDLQVTGTFSSNIIKQYAFIAIVYWNPETNSHTYFAEERHGLTMDGETHSYLHTVFGARFLSGLALQNFTTGTGGLDVDAQFNVDEGSIRDEDILHEILPQTEIPILYRQGANGYWRKKAADSFPVIYSDGVVFTGANGRLPYNQYSGGIWSLTQVNNNKYVLVHFFATNDKENPVVGIQGPAEHDSMSAARTAANAEITSLSGLPFAEFVPIGTVVFRTSNTFSNTPKADVVPINGADYVDFRGTQLYTPAGEATTHGLLSGLGNDDHIQYLLADGTRAMSGELSMGNHKITNLVDPTADQDAATKKYVIDQITAYAPDLTTVVLRDGTQNMTGNLDLNFHKIINVTDPVDDQDAATKLYVDLAVANAGVASDTPYGVSWDGVTDTAPSKNVVYDELETLFKLDGSRQMTGPLDLNSNNVINGYQATFQTNPSLSFYDPFVKIEDPTNTKRSELKFWGLSAFDTASKAMHVAISGTGVFNGGVRPEAVFECYDDANSSYGDVAINAKDVQIGGETVTFSQSDWTTYTMTPYGSVSKDGSNMKIVASGGNLKLDSLSQVDILKTTNLNENGIYNANSYDTRTTLAGEQAQLTPGGLNVNNNSKYLALYVYETTNNYPGLAAGTQFETTDSAVLIAQDKVQMASQNGVQFMSGTAWLGNYSAFGSLVKDGSDMKIEAVADLKLEAAAQIKALAELSMESAKIVNISDPTSAQDAATKAYTDAVNIVFKTAGESITAGDAVYISSGTGSDSLRTSGQVYRLEAKNDDRVEFLGFAQNTVTSGQTVNIQTTGRLSGFTGLTVGKPVFASVAVSGFEGKVQTTSPDANGQWVIQVGVAVSATELLINASGSSSVVKITSEVLEETYFDVLAVNSNTILTSANKGVLASGGSSGITITLPVSSAGKIFIIKKVDTNPGYVIIDTVSGTIDGNPSVSINSYNDSLTFMSDGVNFYLI
jgi:hypothetical protein